MQVFIKSLSGRTIAIPAQSEDTFGMLKAQFAASENLPVDQQMLSLGGRVCQDERTLGDYGVTGESVIYHTVHLCGGGKKRKKKVYTTPKKIKHKHRKTKLAILQYFQVGDDGTVNRLRRECPNCGAGVFMALHKDKVNKTQRQYCGRCHKTLVI